MENIKKVGLFILKNVDWIYCIPYVLIIGLSSANFDKASDFLIGLPIIFGLAWLPHIAIFYRIYVIIKTKVLKEKWISIFLFCFNLYGLYLHFMFYLLIVNFNISGERF